MGFKLQLEKNFVKHYRKLTAVERGMVDDKLRILARDPWHPSLRTKRIQGTGEFEVSVNMDIHGDCLRGRQADNHARHRPPRQVIEATVQQVRKVIELLLVSTQLCDGGFRQVVKDASYGTATRRCDLWTLAGTTSAWNPLRGAGAPRSSAPAGPRSALVLR